MPIYAMFDLLENEVNYYDSAGCCRYFLAFGRFCQVLGPLRREIALVERIATQRAAPKKLPVHVVCLPPMADDTPTKETKVATIDLLHLRDPDEL